MLIKETNTFIDDHLSVPVLHSLTMHHSLSRLTTISYNTKSKR